MMRVRKGARSGFGDAPVEDQLHLFGSAQIEILSDHLLEEDSATYRTVQHLGEREFELPDGKLVAVARSEVCGRIGMRQTAEPFAEERVDLGRRQRVADLL
jgi:hypothetical protein